MVRLINQVNRASHNSLLRDMHADRKRVFVDILGWDVPHDEQSEFDEFDDEFAEYLVLQDSVSGDHLASLRLLRTDRPHLLGGVFPYLCQDEVPSGPDIREVTRLCISPRRRAGERLQARNLLIRSLVEYGLLTGIRAYTGIAEMAWLTEILSAGWDCRPLGMPRNIGGGLAGALIIHIEPNTLTCSGHRGAAIRRRCGSLNREWLWPPDFLGENPVFANAISASCEASLESEIHFWTSQLLAQGYAVIPNAIEATALEGFYADLDREFHAAPFCQGPFFGDTTKRFGRLLLRSRHAAAFAAHELILGIVRRVLLHPLCNTVLLNLTQAIEIHPGAPLQFPHRDQDMFGGDKGGQEYLVNVMWALDDFTQENGATRAWPGSHRSDPSGLLPEKESVIAAMPRGSALIFLGSTLHGAGANRSASPRRGAVFSYCQGWLRPYENPWLAYPPAIARHFDPEIAALVGYCQHLPNLGNFEGQCPSVLLKDEIPEHLHFIDALRDDQMEMVRQYQRENSMPEAA